ncbi:hypothetical protein A3A46_01500 [Candidatus Roizmanbacteria bacterium RIFCSPLOWO2_01_FULL_37_13]|uniref:NAD-dependent epimerase/dehydratase domain-containing protein n=1 Tax=Candidatus Roizmanbacteria bacterium RIFCSPHIGHO2_02_FULL_38_11 TaxID=1802039 RepID=A0A1F7GZY1_9BACT|nr:MAG: hypothetical protein A3C25_01800 [Candidatus Roizmanbacteria bacterium RIFCSPHIGHO2_02_FULL_38_11]OGK42544.1 MAG: hypothetical protein A3A46_01500 [Candidatus Roizmanbacteria bacterium RIFCSPLOWO2_01_FULL_37_13]
MNTIQSLKNKIILITGITGFVGSHLAKKLLSSGAVVFGTSRTHRSKNTFKLSVLNRSALSKLLKKLNVSICIHLGGVSIVQTGQTSPYHTFKTNIQGTLNILECCRQNGLEKVIIPSTSHVYGNNTVPYLEDYPPKPSRPYETSKTATDIISQSYAETFDLPVFIPRFVNIYGPGDLNFERLIPKTIKNALLDRPPTMWGGKVKRSFLYIDDAIDAYIKLASLKPQLGTNRIFNFGTGEVITIEALIKKIIKLSSKKLVIKRIEEGREHEIPSQYVSWKKAKRILKWEPKVSLNAGLKKTIHWYRKFLAVS